VSGGLDNCETICGTDSWIWHGPKSIFQAMSNYRVEKDR